MKFFSKQKRIDNSDKKTDQSPAIAAPPEENEQSVGTDASLEFQSNLSSTIFEASSLQTPLAVLAHKLGFPDSECRDLDDYVTGGGESRNESIFLSILTEKAQSLLDEMETSEKEAPGSEASSFSFDMHLETYISSDGLKAYGFIFPPIGGGSGKSFEQLKTSAQNDGVVYGINEELLRTYAENGTFLKIFTLAEGKTAQDGKDGQIIELYSRDKRISLTVDDKENVDYKNLNWLQTVHKGDVICNIIPPVPAQDGIDVRGNAIKGREGRAPKLPMGKNIVENETQTALIAEVDGYLTYCGGIFKVEQLLQIEEDVDSSVGNLDVIGSVNVKGSVIEGFSIKATGDILVSGRVEGALLEAGGNIKVVGGMNGNFKGKLIAGGNVSSKYLENCYVSASGTVKSDSIINSTVISSDMVIINTGKGVIIGSTVIGRKGVEAKVIGNERNLPTKITVGSDPKLSGELVELKREVVDLTRKIDEYEKNIQYLKSKPAEKLSEEYQQLLNKLRLDSSVMKMSLSKKSARINFLEEELKEGSCQIVANQIYPPLTVTIGTKTQQFTTESRMSRIFKSDGEIIIGSK